VHHIRNICPRYATMVKKLPWLQSYHGYRGAGEGTRFDQSQHRPHNIEI